MCIHRPRSVPHFSDGQHFNPNRINAMAEIVLLLSVFDVPLRIPTHSIR